MSAAKLLPCPFCGGEGRLVGEPPYVICLSLKCGATGPIHDEDGAAWNRRVRIYDPKGLRGTERKAALFFADVSEELTRTAEARKGGGK